MEIECECPPAPARVVGPVRWYIERSDPRDKFDVEMWLAHTGWTDSAAGSSTAGWIDGFATQASDLPYRALDAFGQVVAEWGPPPGRELTGV